ncbi:MAG TPA: class I SAM-dependent methyltransferase [Luteimonas sp.]|nr:class I SAM-dependent methyltransferase [Luteimonas sp.]
MDAHACFQDHFSAVAADYARARPSYPQALFDWIVGVAPTRALAWEPGCGSGQASHHLARRFARVHATDPSAAQLAQAAERANIVFAQEPGERTRPDDACVDAACVAQALHRFDRDAFFGECGGMSPVFPR